MNLKSGLYGLVAPHVGLIPHGFTGAVYLCKMPELELYGSVMHSIIRHLNMLYTNSDFHWCLKCKIGFVWHVQDGDWEPKRMICHSGIEDEMLGTTIQETHYEGISETDLFRLLLDYKSTCPSHKKVLDLMVEVANDAVKALTVVGVPAPKDAMPETTVSIDTPKIEKRKAKVKNDTRTNARKNYDSLPNEGKAAMKQNAALHACKKENLHMDIADIEILFGLPKKSLNRKPFKDIINRGRTKERQESQR